jgi:hypothetical protein
LKPRDIKKNKKVFSFLHALDFECMDLKNVRIIISKNISHHLMISTGNDAVTSAKFASSSPKPLRHAAHPAHVPVIIVRMFGN